MGASVLTVLQDSSLHAELLFLQRFIYLPLLPKDLAYGTDLSSAAAFDAALCLLSVLIAAL